MSRFRRELDRLRTSGGGVRPSFSDQLRLLDPLPLAAGVVREPRAQAKDRLPPGRVDETIHGCHYVIDSDYPETHFHGTVRLGRILPEDLRVLLELAGLTRTDCNRERIVFLDTETTGVHGGAGMCPFLIGIGYYSGDRFRIRQYFIRDFDEESSMLWALGGFLEEFDLIVTYNGRAFDVPLVENRCLLSRLDRPFDHMTHLDLLYMARRLWRASQGSCRLTALEERLVRFLRGPDIHGSKIPGAWFDFLRTGEAHFLGHVFSHNAYDILSLAALTIRAADCLVQEPAPLDDPRDIYSLGRVFDREWARSRSIRYYEMALESALPAKLRIRALERLSVLYRRTGRPERSLDCCLRLIGESSFSLLGYERAALCYEQGGNPEGACRILDEAIARIRRTGGMERALARLEARRARVGKKPSVPALSDL